MIRSIDWERAINTRRSTRSFEISPIEESKMNLLQSFIENMPIPFEHNVKIQMFKANPDKKLYTVFSSPPDNMAFIANTDICSAANSQHWRFRVSSDVKTIYIAMPVGYKHIKWEHPSVDIGICASHFWLGLLMKNIDCKVSLIEEEGRAVWEFQLNGN